MSDRLFNIRLLILPYGKYHGEYIENRQYSDNGGADLKTPLTQTASAQTLATFGDICFEGHIICFSRSSGNASLLLQPLLGAMHRARWSVG